MTLELPPPELPHPNPSPVAEPAVSTLEVDLSRSRRIARSVRPRNGHCYANALHASWKLPSSVYVEGYVVDLNRGYVTRHGWLESDDRIIDVTPAYHGSTARKLYVAAIRWAWIELHREIVAQGLGAVMPVLLRYEQLANTGLEPQRRMADQVLEADRSALAVALQACTEQTGDACLVAA